MIKGTAPTHIFPLPVPFNEIDELEIRYVQRGIIIVSFNREDITGDETTATVHLTIDQTRKFSADVPCDVQMYCVSLGGEPYLSTVSVMDVRDMIPHESRITIHDVFDRAIYLMAENDDMSGETETDDTNEYMVRTIGILNVLIGEAFPYSDTFVPRDDGKRPVLAPVTSFEETTGLDDYVAGTVLPYGLAAKLYIGEDTTQASFFHQRFQELLIQARNIPAVSEEIEDVYGGGYDSEYNQFSRWY